MNSLPTQEDFGHVANLDVNHAWSKFGGKTVEEAYQLYITNPFFYREDLIWMGNKAFIFYFPMAVRYVESKNSRNDRDTVSSLGNLLKFRLEHDAEGIRPAFSQIRSLCDYVVSHYDLFDIEPEIYGDVKAKYSAIKQLAS